MQAQVKQTWLERAISTAKYHARQRRENPKWVLKDTAAALKRSIGSVNQDICIASWLRTHEDKIKSFKTLGEALTFIRSKKHTLNDDMSHLD